MALATMVALAIICGSINGWEGRFRENVYLESFFCLFPPRMHSSEFRALLAQASAGEFS